MTGIRRLAERDRPAWDSLVAAHPASGFMQSWAWSRFKEVDGYAAVRLGLFEKGRLRGGAIAYGFPSPAEGGLLAVPDGPVLDWEAPDAESDWTALKAALRNEPEAARAVALRVEPRLETAPSFLAGLPRAPLDLVPEETWEVSLGTEEAMLGAMRPKARYNARLAARKGVEVRLSSDPSDLHEFHFVLERTGAYQDFLVEPKSFFINLGLSLPPSAWRVALARYRGMTLAAGLILKHGRAATYLYGGHLPLFSEVMANYALHWEVMREAAREGLSVYDLYGYSGPERPDHPYHRFSRFKEKFGGRPVRRMGSRDAVFYDRLAEAALRVLTPQRRPQS